MLATLDRYIARAILVATALALLTLVALASIFAFIGELDDVGRGDYGVAEAARYVLLTVPGKVYLLFAPAVLLGSLLGLGALAANSELTVMRAAGVSTARIVRAVLATGVALMIAVAAIGELVVPRAEQLAESSRLTALDRRLSVRGDSGLWLRSAAHYVNIATVMPDLTLLGVSAHRADDGTLGTALHAERARREGGEWVLEQVSVSRIGEGAVEVERFPRRRWRELAGGPDGEAGPLVSADVLKSLSTAPESLSARALLEQSRYLEANGLDARRIALALWVKLTSPFATLVMLLLSLPFVFGSQRGGGAGQKIFVGILLGTVYVLLNRLLTQLALTYGLPPPLAAMLPLALFLGVGMIGLRRVG